MKKFILLFIILLALCSNSAYDIAGIPQPNAIDFISFKLYFSPVYKAEVWQRNHYVLHDVVSTSSYNQIIPNASTNIIYENATNIVYENATNIVIEGEVTNEVPYIVTNEIPYIVTNVFYYPITNIIITISTNDVIAYSYPPYPTYMSPDETSQMSSLPLSYLGIAETNTVKQFFEALLKLGMQAKDITVEGGGLD